MKEDNRLVCYRLLMSQSSGSGLELSEDAFCRGCKNHRPGFKYRFCAFVECQEIKGMTTYRENSERRADQLKSKKSIEAACGERG